MSISLETYIVIMLTLRIISMTFIFFVIKRQLSLFKLKIDDNVRHFRVVLFVLAMLIFVGNIIPGAIDIYTLTVENAGRPERIQALSIVYTMIANLTATVGSYLIWRLYRLAADTKILSDQLAVDTKIKTDSTEKRLKKERSNK